MFDELINLLVGDLVVSPEIIVVIRLMCVYLILKAIADIITVMLRGSRFGR